MKEVFRLYNIEKLFFLSLRKKIEICTSRAQSINVKRVVIYKQNYNV